MGFSNILGKFYNGALDIMIAMGDQYAKNIDRMTDEEIEKRCSVPADEVRMKAEMLQSNGEMLRMKRDERKMQAEIMRMEQKNF